MRENDVLKAGVIRYIREVLRGNRILRIATILLAGLWITLGTKVITENLLYRERNLKEAMAVTSPGSMSSTISFAGRLKDACLTEADQKEIISYAADQLGVILHAEPEAFSDENRSGYVFRKDAKNASTCIKLVGIREQGVERAYYLIITLWLQEDDGDSLMYYRERIDGIADALAVKEAQTSVQLTGRFFHNMSPAARDRLTDRILKKLGCEVVCENREEPLYTVYAYTKGINEYILSGEDRINVQLAIYYDEIKDETIVCVASPVITGELTDEK